MGLNAKSLASLLKSNAPKVNTIHTKNVLPKLKPALVIYLSLKLKVP